MKTKTQHTPGPWEESHMVAGFIMGADGDYVARTDFPHRMTKGDRSYSGNTRLIAAAPDLLAALQLVRSEIDDAIWGDYVKGVIDAAIGKAEGGI